MKDHEGDSRGYFHYSASWYAQKDRNFTDEVTFGFFCSDGGTSGEMAMRWYHLTEGDPDSPRLECFCDSWHALAQFKDVIDALAEVDGEDITPAQFCELLNQHGFTDLTQREHPHKL